MGNLCCVCRQLEDDDEATNALLDSLEQFSIHSSSSGRPRGPPPPYQARAPLYSMTDEQRAQWVQRLTMIQCLPLGRYNVGEKKEKDPKLELSEEVQGTEKKGDVDRECPICMMEFLPGEPIRLLPCMHFYHMRCIDDWLMRSYSCPTCMERIDVGMRDTISSMTASQHPTLRRRRRRRRGERESTSSARSVSSHGSGQAAADVCSKERESVARRFLIPDACEEHLTASAGTVGSEGPTISGHGPKWSEELPEQEAGNQASNSLGVSHSSGHQVEQYGVAIARNSPQPDFLTGDDEQEHGVFAGSARDRGYGLHHNPHGATTSDPPYDIDQIMQISNFEVDPQEMGPFSPPYSSDLPQATPLSPPMFEYHFEYPATGDLTQQK